MSELVEVFSLFSCMWIFFVVDIQIPNVIQLAKWVVGSVPSWKEVLLLQAKEEALTACVSKNPKKQNNILLMSREAPPASKALLE
jgi:hypothetical protein